MGTGHKSAPSAPPVVVGRLKGTIPLTRLKSQVGALQVAAMVCDTWSQTSSLVINERQLVLQLMLTTLSGEEIQVVIDLQEFDTSCATGCFRFWGFGYVVVFFGCFVSFA